MPTGSLLVRTSRDADGASPMEAPEAFAPLTLLLVWMLALLEALLFASRSSFSVGRGLMTMTLMNGTVCLRTKETRLASILSQLADSFPRNRRNYTNFADFAF